MYILQVHLSLLKHPMIIIDAPHIDEIHHISILTNPSNELIIVRTYRYLVFVTDVMTILLRTANYEWTWRHVLRLSVHVQYVVQYRLEARELVRSCNAVGIQNLTKQYISERIVDYTSWSMTNIESTSSEFAFVNSSLHKLIKENKKEIEFKEQDRKWKSKNIGIKTEDLLHDYEIRHWLHMTYQI